MFPPIIKSISCCLLTSKSISGGSFFIRKQCLICAYFSPDLDETTLSLEEAMLWSGILARSNGLKFKNVFMYLFLTNTELLASQDVNWRNGVVWIICGLWCFYQLFGLSFWRHPFTADDPLVSTGAPLRILGPLDSIFTRALLHSRGIQFCM